MDSLVLAANGAFKVPLMARRDAVTPLQHQINAAAVSEPQHWGLLRICVTACVCVSGAQCSLILLCATEPPGCVVSEPPTLLDGAEELCPASRSALVGMEGDFTERRADQRSACFPTTREVCVHVCVLQRMG